MKILIVTSFFSIFTEGLIDNLKQNRKNINVSVLSPDQSFVSQENIDHFIQFENGRIGKNIKKGVQKYNSWKNTIKELDEDYDVINLQFANILYSFFSTYFKKKTKVLITSLWGSDFYRASTIRRCIQKRIYKASDFITFTNPRMGKDFLNYYGKDFENKIHTCRFGLSPLGEIAKLTKKEECTKYFNFNNKKIKVAIGYSAVRPRQHIQILNILKDQKALLDKIQLIFPVTYGDKNYIKEIKMYITDNLKNADSIFIENHLDISEVAKLRKAIDIMINTPITDQLSGSMLETLYAGNIVINGSWLPYQLLDEKGIYAEKVNSLYELPPKLEYIINNYDTLYKKGKKNQDIIWKMSSWEENITSWIHLYENSKFKR